MPFFSQPSKTKTPIPSGKYLAVIVKSAFYPERKKNAKYLEFEYQIIQGPYKNTILKSRHRLEGYNLRDYRAAKIELDMISRAVDVIFPSDSSQLHNRPLCITVDLMNNRNNRNESNEIIGWESKNHFDG